MKKRILIYLTPVIFVFASCKKKEAQVEDSETVNLVTIDTLMIPKSTQGLKPSLRLIPKAQDAVKEWPLYQNLTQRLDSLDGVPLRITKNQLSILILMIDGKEEEEEEVALKFIPYAMQTPAIQARLLSLETKMKIVNNHAQKSDPKAGEISNSIVELKNAFQNLNLQINENFAMTIEEMLEQLNQEVDDINPPTEIENPNPTRKPPVKIIKQNQ